eukprot:TRINITY_DN30344_c0_g2_i1.p1 TRINITY_DN30344_c0_g2~~TRINITY_DN30344_c0_g2_i1.p1  ORF type:complete len:709 (+),score=112.08 TRINITY_DN30344_c0_g2_i1:49-2127(+)
MQPRHRTERLRLQGAPDGASFGELLVSLLKERAKVDVELQRLRLENKALRKGGHAVPYEAKSAFEHITTAHSMNGFAAPLTPQVEYSHGDEGVVHVDSCATTITEPETFVANGRHGHLAPSQRCAADSSCLTHRAAVVIGKRDSRDSTVTASSYAQSVPSSVAETRGVIFVDRPDTILIEGIEQLEGERADGHRPQARHSTHSTLMTSLAARFGARGRPSTGSDDSADSDYEMHKMMTDIKSMAAKNNTARGLILAGEDVEIFGDTDSILQKLGPGDTVRVRICRLLKWWPLDVFISTLVAIDCIFLGVSVQRSLHPSGSELEPLLIDIFDKSCTVIYCLELCLRVFGYGPVFCLRNGFVRLDMLLVGTSLVDLLMQEMLSSSKKGQALLGQLTVLRILRLARMARAARLVARLRTLWLLISGLGHAALTILWTFLLITGMSYAFAIAGMELFVPRDLNTDTVFNEVAVRHFGSMQVAMLTLLQVLTLDSISAVYRPLILEGGNKSWLAAVYFILYILVVSIALMNLVTAVMVEGATQQAFEDKEFKDKYEEEQRRKMFPAMRHVFQTLDLDGDGEVSLAELSCADEDLQETLRGLTGSWSWNPFDLFTLMDTDCDGIVRVEEFLETCIRCARPEGMQQFQIERLVRQVARLKQLIEEHMCGDIQFGHEASVSACRSRHSADSVAHAFSVSM